MIKQEIETSSKDTKWMWVFLALACLSCSRYWAIN